jgi:hypothetical protein
MRNVRPSWVRVSKSDTDNGPVPFWKGTGPKSRKGALSVEMLARVNGSAVPFLTVDAIGSADGKSVLWTVRDRNGRTIHEETVPQ